MYVAPEQLEGGHLSPATDVYSFGVVLYEITTGRWPFHGSNRMETALLRLSSVPPTPRSINPALPRQWDAVIMKCLSRNASDRFSSTKDISSALLGTGRTLVAKRELKRYRVVALAIVALFLGIWAAQWLNRSISISPAVRKRRSVAVIEPVSMEGIAGDKTTVSQITQLLTNDLETINSIRVVPHYEVAQLRLASTGGTSELTPAVLRSIRTQMDSDFVVTGAYALMRNKEGPVLRIDLKLYDAKSGELEAAVSASGPPNAPLELQNELSNQLRAKLGLKLIEKVDAEHLLVSIPPDPSAQKLYSEAIEKLHHYDSAGAMVLLKQVTQISPKFPLAHLDLAEAYSSLGYDSLARDEAAQARGMLNGFSSEKKIYVEARSHELSREWKPAIELYKDLVRSYPDNPEYWLRLALTEGAGGQKEDALQTIATARDSLHTQDPRFALAEADIQDRSGNFQKLLDASSRAVDLSARLNATPIEAKALVMKCWATLNLGHPIDARSDCEKAADLSKSVQDEATHAKALNVTANSFLKQGNINEAEKLFKQVFQILGGIGDERNLGGAHLNYGNALFNRSDFNGAEREYRLSLSTAEKRQAKADIALATANIAGVLMAKGKLADAEKMYVDALGTARSVGADLTTARCLNNLGVVQASRGELSAAMASYNDALDMRSKLGSEDGRAVVFTEMGDVLLQQGDFGKARERYRDALAIQQRLDERDDVARTQLSLAEATVLEGNATAALPELRNATAALEGLSDSAWAAVGHSRIALALSQGGDRKQALSEADTALRMLGNTDEIDARMETQLNAAEVRASDQKTASSVIQPLEALLTQAGREGLLEPQLRARLLLAGVKSHGDRQLRRILLDSIRTEAEARGLNYVAMKAQKMLAD